MSNTHFQTNNEAVLTKPLPAISQTHSNLETQSLSESTVKTSSCGTDEEVFQALLATLEEDS